MGSFELKPCIIAGAGAFLLSALLGLMGGAGFLALALRALVLGAFFFGLVAGAQVLISRFLPELLNPGASSPEQAGDFEEGGFRPGGRVNLSVGDDFSASGEGAPGSEELPVDELPGGDDGGGPIQQAGLDQDGEGGYTGADGRSGSGTEAVPARPPELIGDVDVLPDLEGMSDSFITPVNIGDDSGKGSGSAPRGASSAAIPLGDAGTFDAKEMAMAIQTILKREEKG